MNTILQKLYRRLRSVSLRIVNPIRYFGSRRYCNVCDRSSRLFLPGGENQREDARCPRCGSLERHRLVMRFFDAKTNLFDGQFKNVLHVAPENCFARRFHQRIGQGYLTADLFGRNAMEKMDVCDIHHPDESFNVIYCSHVLEHVPNDRQAIREFYRTLKVDGWAVLNVPITTEKTFEDPSITDPAERLRLFGQEDHVRRYGPDYEDRLKEVGFSVQCYRPQELLSPTEIERLGMSNGEAGDIYFCRKD